MKRFTVCVLVLLATAVLVALTSAPAYAVDGVVLINQNTSVSGLPGCGSTGFPIVICQSGSYRLSGNLVVSGAADGIDIHTDNVSLDLNGFTISGPVVCTGQGSGISCTGAAGFGINTVFPYANNIAVRNGVVRGFSSGIGLFGDSNRVEEITATRNSNVGIDVRTGLLRRNNAFFNASIGISTDVAATVTENVVIGNGFIGLTMLFGTYGSNTFSGNPKPVNTMGAVSQGNNDCGTGSPC